MESRPQNWLAKILEDDPKLHAKLVCMGQRFKHYLLAEDLEAAELRLKRRFPLNQNRILN